mmetsp:Transcript_19287/g.26120  ORF Transcript_19287/g.26120 Transcript_19287/m.26120 type:complete len:134 (+) Transcript_19287:1405-1806(+)
MLAQGKLPCSGAQFMGAIAEHRDSEGRNLLHEATLAVLEGELRFFLTLIKLGFPLYGEDGNLETPAFLLCGTKDEAHFKMCLTALIAAGFDINKENDDDDTFLQKLCCTSKISLNRIQAMLHFRPLITEDHLS